MEPREVEVSVSASATASAATAMPSAEPAIACCATDAACCPTSSAVLLRVAVSTLDPESGISAETTVVTSTAIAAAAATRSERRGSGILPEIESISDTLQPEQRQGAQGLPDTLLPVVERQELSERAVSL